jgi:hypothetical protein
MTRLKSWGVALIAGWMMAVVMGSTDAPLRGLVEELVPTLRSHHDTAKTPVDSARVRSRS